MSLVPLKVHQPISEKVDLDMPQGDQPQENICDTIPSSIPYDLKKLAKDRYNNNLKEFQNSISKLEQKNIDKVRFQRANILGRNANLYARLAYCKSLKNAITETPTLKGSINTAICVKDKGKDIPISLNKIIKICTNYLNEKSNNNVFEWKSFNITDNNLIEALGHMATIDKYPTSTYESIVISGKERICNLDNEPKAQERLEENLYVSKSNIPRPFRNKTSDIYSFYLLKHPDASYNKMFTNNLIAYCENYKYILNNPFNIEYATSKNSSEVGSKYHLHTIPVQFNVIDTQVKQLNNKILNILKDLATNSGEWFTLKEYIDLIETEIILETKLMTLITCSIAEEALKSVIIREILSNMTDRQAYDAIVSGLTMPNPAQKLKKILRINKHRINTYSNLGKVLSDGSFSMASKDAMLVHHPRTYAPSDQMAKAILQHGWNRFCQFDVRVTNVHKNANSAGTAINHLDFNTASYITNGALPEKTKDTMMLLIDHIVFNNLELLEGYMDQMKAIANEVFLIQEEMTDNSMYRTCFSVRKNITIFDPINTKTAISMLSNIFTRQAHRITSVKSSFTDIVFYLMHTIHANNQNNDLLNLFNYFKMVNDLPISMHSTIHANIKNSLPLPEPETYSTLTDICNERLLLKAELDQLLT
ncbi:hypothetical protein NEOKW01_1964 [Nematocida sp. AWRm80]|nr:hypothetical protein NEOKW01_1964 [Nematocida sp. AWRm80]